MMLCSCLSAVDPFPDDMQSKRRNIQKETLASQRYRESRPLHVGDFCMTLASGRQTVDTAQTNDAAERQTFEERSLPCSENPVLNKDGGCPFFSCVKAKAAGRAHQTLLPEEKQISKRETGILSHRRPGAPKPTKHTRHGSAENFCT